MQHEQIEMTSCRKEAGKLEHANRKLGEELRLLREHIAEETVPRKQMEAYKKEVEEKVDTYYNYLVHLPVCRDSHTNL